MLADRRYCYPLTITDFASRYLLCCDALETTQRELRLHRLRARVQGLWPAARDPHRQRRALRQHHRLLRPEQALGVVAAARASHIERIKPGHPQQNGRHERMHLTLKKEATKPAAKNFLQQQAKFDRFIECFNHERPHQALGMQYPAELYQPSARPYRGLSELDYPFHDRTITVTRCGRICFGGRKINLSAVFAGQNVGIKEVGEKIWLVSFMHYDLGFFDHETRSRRMRARTPSRLKCYLCLRNKPLPM